jgi:DNA-binding NarL/FixJ family response regulator
MTIKNPRQLLINLHTNDNDGDGDGDDDDDGDDKEVPHLTESHDMDLNVTIDQSGGGFVPQLKEIVTCSSLKISSKVHHEESCISSKIDSNINGTLTKNSHQEELNQAAEKIYGSSVACELVDKITSTQSEALAKQQQLEALANEQQ